MPYLPMDPADVKCNRERRVANVNIVQEALRLEGPRRVEVGVLAGVRSRPRRGYHDGAPEHVPSRYRSALISYHRQLVKVVHLRPLPFRPYLRHIGTRDDDQRETSLSKAWWEGGSRRSLSRLIGLEVQTKWSCAIKEDQHRIGEGSGAKDLVPSEVRQDGVSALTTKELRAVLNTTRGCERAGSVCIYPC